MKKLNIWVFVSMLIIWWGCSNNSDFTSKNGEQNKRKSNADQEKQKQQAPGLDGDLAGNDTFEKSGNGDGTGQSAIGLDSEEIRGLCQDANRSKLMQTKNLLFPPTQNCEFGSGGNGERRDVYYQARVKVDRTFEVPENGVICSFKLDSKTNNIRYDDVVVITLNDYILATSNRSIYQNSTPPNSISKFEFLDILGRPLAFEGTQSCLGEEASICKMPGHDFQGGFELDFNNEVLSPLLPLIYGPELKTLSVITLGDNDDGDCEHTGIEFDVTYTYVDLSSD